MDQRLSGSARGRCFSGFARTRDQLGMNIDLRLLEDVESPAQGGYFLAAVHGGYPVEDLDPGRHGNQEAAPGKEGIQPAGNDRLYS